MAVEPEPNIMKSMKKVLNVALDDDSFDQDIMLHINSVFNTLHDLGIGPDAGFMLEDDEAEWDDFTNQDVNLNSVKSYVYLRVRLLFDPPATSFAIDAMQSQAKELEWRLNAKREGEKWVSPYPQSIEMV